MTDYFQAENRFVGARFFYREVYSITVVAKFVKHYAENVFAKKTQFI